MYYEENDSWGFIILKLIGCLILICMIGSCSKSCSRSENDMIYIKEGYCYNRNSHIIYIESESGKYGTNTVYTPYYDENGNLCKYNIHNGQWTPVIIDQ